MTVTPVNPSLFCFCTPLLITPPSARRRYYDRVQAIRTSKLWVEQGEEAGWLIKSPQARLEGYNPLVMIKLKMLRDAARLNPWGSRYQ